MEARLKLISKRIHWSLLLKSLLCGVLAAYGPNWLFVLAVLYVYFIPWFRPVRFLVPLLMILACGFVLPAGPMTMLLVSALTFVLVGIKDLVIIRREDGWEFFTILSLFALGNFYFVNIHSWGVRAVWGSVGAGVSGLWLFGELIRLTDDGRLHFLLNKRKLWVLQAISALFISESLLVLTLIPAPFIFQLAIFLVFAAGIVETLLDYLKSEFSFRRILFYLSILFGLTVILLAANNWGL